MAITAHATNWTVATDPPQAARTLTFFDTQAEAEVGMAALIAGGQRHVYVLPPCRGLGSSTDRPHIARLRLAAGPREAFTMLLSQIVALTARVDAALDPELSPPRPSNR